MAPLGGEGEDLALTLIHAVAERVMSITLQMDIPLLLPPGVRLKDCSSLYSSQWTDYRVILFSSINQLAILSYLRFFSTRIMIPIKSLNKLQGQIRLGQNLNSLAGYLWK